MIARKQFAFSYSDSHGRDPQSWQIYSGKSVDPINSLHDLLNPMRPFFGRFKRKSSAVI